MSSLVKTRSDALIARAILEIRQRIANMHHNGLDPQAWRILIVSCNTANVEGRRLVETFLRTTEAVPDGDEQVFYALEQNSLFGDRLRRVGIPESLIEQVGQPVPPGHVAVVCSVVGGLAVVHLRSDEHALPPPQAETRIVEMPPEGERRYTYLLEQLETICLTYARMVGEGADPGAFSVLLVDPNSNAMGLKLIEEVEADESVVARVKAKAERGTATAYFNIAQNDQLGPFMAALKVEVDGRVKESAITMPVRLDSLRVVVCTANGASTFDIDRPVKVAGPGVPEA